MIIIPTICELNYFQYLSNDFLETILQNEKTKNMDAGINRSRLFIASCVALTVTSMTFAIRAGMLTPLGKEFGLDNAELGWIAGTAFWGFPLAVIIGGALVDSIGMKRLMWVAFGAHVLGIILTILSGGFWGLFFSTLLIGIANGTVEAACNPLVASMYPEDKTTKLNHFHIWFPGGLVIGGLVAYFFGEEMMNMGWQIQMAIMLIPAFIYGYLYFGQKFPVTERVAEGVSTGEMYKSMATPLFIFMVFCMFATAITELGTNQWIAVLLSNVTKNSILLLVFVSGIMALGRGFAGPIVHRFSPEGVLLFSSIFAALGLYLLGSVEGMGMSFFAAGIFAVGVTYFWPTMLGFVAENIPKSGAIGLAVMGGAGMFATSIFLPIIGSVYDKALKAALPENADLKAYAEALENTPEALAYAEAQVIAGPSILMNMAILPLVLIAAFTFLYFYMRKRRQA